MNPIVGRFVCGGMCGKQGCDYQTNSCTLFGLHKNGRPKRQCKICKGVYVDLGQHMRAMHPQAPFKKRKTFPVMRFSNPFSDTIASEQWHWLKKKVNTMIMYDLRNKNLKHLHDNIRRYQKNNNGAYAIASKVAARYLAMDKTGDDAGGRIPGAGMHLRAYSIWQLSLDRIDETKPHFSLEYDKLLDNVNFVILGINNCCRIVSKHGSQTCAMLRTRMQETVSQEDVKNALKKLGEQPVSANKTLVSIQSAWYQDDKTRENFDNNREQYFEYCRRVIATQNYRCRHSGIFMGKKLNGPEDPDAKCFQASIDAIDPSKGHVKGNIQ